MLESAVTSLGFSERHGGRSRSVRRFPVPLSILLRLLEKVRRLREEERQQEKVRGGTYISLDISRAMLYTLT
jgi:hypothetical protein